MERTMSLDTRHLQANTDQSALLTHTLPLDVPGIKIESLLPVATVTEKDVGCLFPIYRCSDSIALQAASAHFIRNQYWVSHRAILTSLMHQRFAILNAHDMPCAVVGLKVLRHQSTLVERYLDDPIEQAVSRVVGQSVAREQLVEVGNLAADSLIQSARLIIFLLHWLKQAGISHAVCTGTQAVRLALKRARVPFDIIGSADPIRLGDERWKWGTYYQNAPKILVIDIHQGLAAVGERCSLDLAPLAVKGA
jgi:hypothetical protein